jgi:hypothetical protein
VVKHQSLVLVYHDHKHIWHKSNNSSINMKWYFTFHECQCINDAYAHEMQCKCKLNIRGITNSLQSHSQRWGFEQEWERECGSLRERAFFLDLRLKKMKSELEREKGGACGSHSHLWALLTIGGSGSELNKKFLFTGENYRSRSNDRGWLGGVPHQNFLLSEIYCWWRVHCL